jgi:hypothetical protein
VETPINDASTRAVIDPHRRPADGAFSSGWLRLARHIENPQLSLVVMDHPTATTRPIVGDDHDAF